MLPDPGCYEERDRVTGRDALGLAAGLLAIGLGFLWHTQAIFLVIGVVLVIPAVMVLARRQLAFRADHAGILLGGKHNRLTTRRGPAVLIPWADVEQIILYSSEPDDQAPVQRIGIQLRNGAPEARKITGWRLDRDRLAALTAVMAPDVRIVEAVANIKPGIEGPIQAALSSNSDPRIKRRARPRFRPSGSVWVLGSSCHDLDDLVCCRPRQCGGVAARVAAHPSRMSMSVCPAWTVGRAQWSWALTWAFG